ncbi:MAG: dephospho-CoA kinase [Oscillospiraceae bacterium]|nr:dephospho-CoA kinase [Oscillospiraceae bacterium]
MKIIGLTGGSGAGKGEACKAFLSFGIKSIDTDKIAREVTKKSSECLRELVENFSGDILDNNGELDRKKLAEIAFSSKVNHDMLNKITHKYILSECESIIIEAESGGINAIIIDAPMLFESGFDKKCDFIISVISDLEKRTERIIKRDGITKEQAETRIKNQKSNEFFVENSDYIIYNNSDYNNVYVQVLKIYNFIFNYI